MAFIAKQRYKLDLAPKGGWVIVYASQHDDGAREIEFEITNQGNAYSIPASINVSVQGIKSNGSYFSHSCSYSGNIVTMALADDMTDIIGKSICVLKFTNSSQQKLATAKFVLNVDTDSSSEGVIIDTEAEEIFNQMLNEIRAQASAISVDIAELQSYVAELQSMVGSPLVASLVSEMTDHNKIYVYTGSESGYTNGNWYYWNDTEWQSGGQYNSVPIIIDQTPTSGSTNTVSSNGVYTALGNKVDKVSGKGLSTEDYTTAEKTKLAGLTQIEVDDTLSVEGRAADAKKTGDEISKLQTTINQNLISIRKAFPTSTNLFNIDDPDVMNGEYITNTGQQGTSQTGVLCESGWIAVEPSTQYTIGADSTNYPRYITEYDSSKSVISGGASEANITTSANTAYIRFCFRNIYTNWRMNKGGAKLPYEPFYIDYIKTDSTLTDEYLPANAKAVGDMFANAGFSNQTYTADDVLALTFTDGYVGTSGGTSSSQSLHYSNHIPVNEGDVLYTDGSSSFRFVCAYNANGSAGTASGAESVTRYTVPSGIKEVVVTLYKTYTGVVRHFHEDSVFVQSNGQLGYFRAEGNLSDGDTLTLPVTNVNKNVRQAFTADITSFSGLLIGRKNGNQGYWAVIDGTNITIYRDNVASGSIPHGLIVQNNIQIRIVSHSDLINPNDLYNVDITITSNGIDFTAQNIGWVRTYNNPIVQSIGSTLTNCVMSWEAGDVNKAIYMFGDSYFSWYPQRWTYYCAKDGFANNALFNAYAGENTANAVIALRNVLPMGRPKYLVWCLGMNDGSDKSYAPSSAWVTGRDTVINICKRYGITPIFGTIPTVPSINHEQKNAWIRSSGYRYIDFAKAVGASASGEWYSGMIESDNVHPSEKGAKALYGRVLTDFPEIMVSN